MIFKRGSVDLSPASCKFFLVFSDIAFILSEVKKILILIIALLVASCSNTSLYKITVTQGTVFKQEDIDKVQKGMTKDQVIFILGNPTFENFFEPDVWNYFYQAKIGDEILSESKLKVKFNNDGLVDEVIVLGLDSGL